MDNIDKKLILINMVMLLYLTLFTKIKLDNLLEKYKKFKRIIVFLFTIAS